MAKAKPRSKSKAKKGPSKGGPGKNPSRKADAQRRGSPFNSKGPRNYGAIFLAVFVMAIMLLSAMVVVMDSIPGFNREEDPKYGVRAFFYNANHTAEKGGHTEYAMYIGNTGNTKDNFQVKTVNNAGNFEIWFGIFSVDAGVENNAHLTEGAASSGLIDLFSDNGQELSDKATVTKVDDNNWQIEDGYIEYRVSKALSLLNFFQYGQASIPLKDGKSTVIIVAADASSRAKGLNYAEIQVRSLKSSAAKTTIRFNVEVVDDLGEAITKDDSVGMWYIGMLTEGTMFDANVEGTVKNTSIPRKKSLSEHFTMFDLEPTVGQAGVIEGWQKGVPGLKNSETKVIRIPPKMAYGDTGDHDLAGEELIFEITLGAVY